MSAASPALRPPLPPSAPPRLAQRILPPMDLPTTWHVSPTVDLWGYAFSWVYLALPVYLLFGSTPLSVGESRPAGIAFIAAAVILIDLHRHFTFPYVYLDRRLRSRFPLRFWLMPALMALLLSQLPAFSRSATPVSGPAVGAILAWTLLLVQLLGEDRGGAERRRWALGIAGVSAALGGVLTLLSRSALDPAWVWLVTGAGASLLLSSELRRPQGAAPEARSGLSAALFPGAMLTLLAGSALLDPSLAVRDVVNGVIGFYVAWLAYHVVMQKYGIFRIYSAKSGHTVKVPGWVDKGVLWSWVPMFFIWTVGRSPDQLLRYLDNLSRGTARLVRPSMGFVQEHFVVLAGLSFALIAVSIATFLWYEWRVHRFRNAPRLWFATGTLGLYASFFAIGPAGLYVAFAATHCIEYITFVWAFQRRRYRGIDPDAPLLSRLVQRPFVYYGVFTLVVAAGLFYGRYATRYLGVDPQSHRLFGSRLTVWVFWYSIIQAFIHFYYDGFLWKLRGTDLRRSL